MGQARPRPPLVLRDREHVVVEAVDEDPCPFSGSRRVASSWASARTAFGDDAAVDAGVDVGGGGPQRELRSRPCPRSAVVTPGVCSSYMPQSVISARSAAQELGAGVRGEEGGEVLGAQLLLALDQHPDVARERPVDREQRLDRRERREDLALVVGDAARVEAAVADLGLERRRVPELVRSRGLDVVVAVDEDGRCARRRGATRRRRSGCRPVSTRRTPSRPIRSRWPRSHRAAAAMSAACSDAVLTLGMRRSSLSSSRWRSRARSR